MAHTSALCPDSWRFHCCWGFDEVNFSVNLQDPNCHFGTVNGVIGVIASLPKSSMCFWRTQSNLRKVIKGVGGLSHEQWRSFNNEKKTVDAKNFLDGDLIESFLDLSRSKMDEISKQMRVSVEELCKRVEELTRLH
ncbi:hypothetical protein Pyn_18225 [Prunus yedoensis var. nudiflora]|uniref:RSE1/DDB1/CPSF1 C-terminal domain-containing protein n=1 Tax=Prunus yedoensis var. nudiflora TaxID=2094558 RepID=A0A314XTL0_PRUYE|nr:hypothetical protein Pyn_18225 [Prunus yedoensis var. nudiflora]